jgi:starvation-inducible DNA-binding protein
MNEKNAPLAEALAITLSDLVTFSFITQGYHWNVIGSDFKEYHALFGELYGDVSGSIDPIAENILKLGFEAPYLLSDFQSMTRIRAERIVGGEPVQMVESLVQINEGLIEELKALFRLANELDEQGIANFTADRIDAHQKWQWQLKATLGIR